MVNGVIARPVPQSELSVLEPGLMLQRDVHDFMSYDALNMIQTQFFDFLRIELKNLAVGSHAGNCRVFLQF